jgi:TolC family type I secretion outer membrane protein
MKKRLTILILAAGLLQAGELTMQSCLQKALANHPDVKAYLLRVEQEHEGVKSVKSAWLPQISGYAEYDAQRTYVMPNPMKESFRTVDDTGWNAGISLTQKVFDFSKTSHRVESSKLRHKIAELGYEEAAALMRYRVRNAYTLVLVQKSAMRSRRKDLEAKKALYEQARALVRQGLKTRADESRFLSAVRQAEDALALATAAYDKAVIALEALIGEEIPETASFEESLLENDPVKRLATEREVMEKNPGLRIARESVNASEAAYKATKAEHYGSIDIVADLSHFDTLSAYDNKLLGIRYAVPIYSGGRLSAQAQQAKISQMIASETEESRRRALLQEVRGIYADLHETDKRIEARKAQLLSANETKALVEARYKEGLSTYMEVLDAEAMWLDARLGLLSARYTKLEKIYRLEYLDAQ